MPNEGHRVVPNMDVEWGRNAYFIFGGAAGGFLHVLGTCFMSVENSAKMCVTGAVFSGLVSLGTSFLPKADNDVGGHLFKGVSNGLCLASFLTGLSDLSTSIFFVLIENTQSQRTKHLVLSEQNQNINIADSQSHAVLAKQYQVVEENLKEYFFLKLLLGGLKVYDSSMMREGFYCVASTTILGVGLDQCLNPKVLESRFLQLGGSLLLLGVFDQLVTGS